MSVSVVASPRFEPANLSRTESGDERLALHKNHEGRAQAVAAMRGYGMTAVGKSGQIAVLAIARRLIEFGYSVQSASRSACFTLIDSLLGDATDLDDEGFSAEAFLQSICNVYAFG